MPTKQETFDTVAKHLLTQNAKANGEGFCGATTCMYRAPDGKQCAAGCLIPDDRYTPELERNSVMCHSGDGVGRPFKVGELIIELGHDLQLVYELQRVHDYYQPEEWPNYLRGLARDFGLSTEVLDNA